MTLPREFRSRIASHNRHAIAAVLLCLLGSSALWALGYALIVGITLGFLTSIHGEEAAAGTWLLLLPWWIQPTAFACASLLLLWGAIDRRFLRFRPVSDRQIIGWHVLGDVLLAPPRLTFGIWDHLRALIHLNEKQKCEAFALLRHIHHERRCSLSSLGSLLSGPRRLPKLLDALQLIGWIGLLRHDEEWCYIIPSTEEETVANLMHAEKSEEEAIGSSQP